MRDIEKHNPQLAGVLPKTYNLFTSTLLKELLKKVSEIPAALDYDAFGRIYDYFLREFAMSEGQGGGEPSGASSTTGTVARRVSASDSANQFYTPSSIVRLLTEVIEPYLVKIIGQNHQFLGVNNAIAVMLAARKLGRARGGVFWRRQFGRRLGRWR